MPVTGDVVGMEIRGAGVLDDSGQSPPMDGCVVLVEFLGMARRHPVNDPVANGSTLVIVIDEPGYTNGVLTTNRYTIRGTLPLHNQFPRQWSTLPGVVPPRSWCANTIGTGSNQRYYTEAGGTRNTAGSAPNTAIPGTAGLGSNGLGAAGPGNTDFTDGTVVWKPYADDSPAGYVEVPNGANTKVVFVLDLPIAKNATVVSASIGAGAYRVGGVSSTGGAISSSICVNNSTFEHGPMVVQHLSLAHAWSTTTGSMADELVIESASYYGGRSFDQVEVKYWAWDGSASVAALPCRDTEPSQIITAAGYAGIGAEVARIVAPDLSTLPKVNTTGGAVAGDCFKSYRITPRRGAQVYDSLLHGEGADYRNATAYAFKQIVRGIGANNIYLYSVTIAGTSAATGTGPSGNSSTAPLADGTATFVYFGSLLTSPPSGNPQARVHFLNDPAVLYKTGWAFVESGSVTGVPGSASGTAGVFPTEALMRANTDPTKMYPTAATAAVAIKTWNNTATSDAVGKVLHNDGGNARMVGRAGTHQGFGGDMVTPSGRGALWTIFSADTAAVVGSVLMPLATLTSRAPPRRAIVEGFKSDMGSVTAGLFDPQADATTSGAPIAQGSTELIVRNMDISATGGIPEIARRTMTTAVYNSRITGGFYLSTANNTRHCYSLLAGNLFDSRTGLTTINCRNMVANRVTTVGGTGKVQISDPSNAGQPRSMHMVFIRNIVAGTTAGGSSNSPLVLLFTGSTTNPVSTALSCNIVDARGASDRRAIIIAGDQSTGDLTNVYLINNLMPAGGANFFYEDLTATPLRLGIHFQRNILANLARVGGYYPHSNSPRSGARSNNEPFLYSVDVVDNVSFSGGSSSAGNFSLDGNVGCYRAGNNTSWDDYDPDSPGYGTTTPTRQALFVNDQANITPVGTADADWHPSALGVVAFARATSQAQKYDLDMRPRLQDGTGLIGPYERPPAYPVLPATQTIQFGSDNTSGYGGHDCNHRSADGSASSNPLTVTGGTVAALFTINSYNRLTPNGSGAMAAGTVIVTDAAAGVSSTVTIVILPNSHFVRDSPVDDVNYSQLKKMLERPVGTLNAPVGGDQVILRDGSSFNPSLTDHRIRVPAGGYGVGNGQPITIRPETVTIVSKPSGRVNWNATKLLLTARLGRLSIDARNIGSAAEPNPVVPLRFYGVHFTATNQALDDNTRLLSYIDGSGSGYAPYGVVIDSCRFDTDDLSPLLMSGISGGPGWKTYDSSFYNLANAYGGYGLDVVIERNDIRRTKVDGLKAPWNNASIRFNYISSQMAHVRANGALGDHADNLQGNYGNTPVKIDRTLKLVGNIIGYGASDPHVSNSHLYFLSDVNDGGYLAGLEVYANMGFNTESQGIDVDHPKDARILNNMVVQDVVARAGGVSSDGLTPYDQPLYTTIQTESGIGGLIDGNIANTYSYISSITPPTLGTNVSMSATDIASFQAKFVNPQFGGAIDDYDDFLGAFTPLNKTIANGGLVRPDGSVIGPVGLDGKLNLPTPPLVGTATAVLQLFGSAVGKHATAGSAAATLSFVAAAAATQGSTGNASAALQIRGGATGVQSVAGTGAGSLLILGGATGTFFTPTGGIATAILSIEAAGTVVTGEVGVGRGGLIVFADSLGIHLPPSIGAASAVIVFDGSADAGSGPKGSSAGLLYLIGGAAGLHSAAPILGPSSASFGLLGTAVGLHGVRGTASGTLAVIGGGMGGFAVVGQAFHVLRFEGTCTAVFTPLPPAVRSPEGVRLDRVLNMSIDDGRSAFIAGTAGSSWYRVFRLGIWTIDLDPADRVFLSMDWKGMFVAPLVVSAAVTDDSGLTVSDVSASVDGVVFKAGGGAGVIHFVVTHGPGNETDRMSVRVRARVQ